MHYAWCPRLLGKHCCSIPCSLKTILGLIILVSFTRKKKKKRGLLKYAVITLVSQAGNLYPFPHKTCGFSLESPCKVQV